MGWLRLVGWLNYRSFLQNIVSYAIWPPIPKTIFIKHSWVEIIAFPFVLFDTDRFFIVCCLERFSAAYLLKLFLLPQHAHTTLFIRGDKPELTRWCLCSLHAGVQMSPDKIVGSRDGCRHSIAESTAIQRNPCQAT